MQARVINPDRVRWMMLDIAQPPHPQAVDQRRGKESMISPYYEETQDAIKVGDRIVLDGVYEGIVVGVFLPKSAEAKDYACFDTGGLLIDMEVSGLTLEPFGSVQEIRKIGRSAKSVGE